MVVLRSVLPCVRMIAARKLPFNLLEFLFNKFHLTASSSNSSRCHHHLLQRHIRSQKRRSRRENLYHLRSFRHRMDLYAIQAVRNSACHHVDLHAAFPKDFVVIILLTKQLSMEIHHQHSKPLLSTLSQSRCLHHALVVLIFAIQGFLVRLFHALLLHVAMDVLQAALLPVVLDVVLWLNPHRC